MGHKRSLTTFSQPSLRETVSAPSKTEVVIQVLTHNTALCTQKLTENYLIQLFLLDHILNNPRIIFIKQFFNHSKFSKDFSNIEK